MLTTENELGVKGEEVKMIISGDVCYISTKKGMVAGLMNSTNIKKNDVRRVGVMQLELLPYQRENNEHITPPVVNSQVHSRSSSVSQNSSDTSQIVQPDNNIFKNIFQRKKF